MFLHILMILMKIRTSTEFFLNLAYQFKFRELTQLQTILQNQIEKFGQHFFKEGSMVILIQIGYDSLYHAIELEDTFLGIPISEYLDKLVGKTIRGEISGVEQQL